MNLKKLISIAGIGIFCLTACDNSKEPEKKTFYQLFKDKIYVFNVLDKETKKANEQKQPEAVSFLDGVIYHYKIVLSQTYEPGYTSINGYDCVSTLIDSGDYSLNENTIVTRNCNLANGMLASYTLVIDNEKLIAKKPNTNESAEFVTKKFAEKNNIQIVNIIKDNK